MSNNRRTTDEVVADLAEHPNLIAQLGDQQIADLVCVLEARKADTRPEHIVSFIGALIKTSMRGPKVVSGSVLHAAGPETAEDWLGEFFEPDVAREIVAKLG
ncbi:MAG: hypothetical protein ABJX32_06200 [Tateyamaria sp.]|uniref:hypothetical protein n=1 Tax=Tateyamaria sp. TaxID=1929288 RepID=UPI00329EFFDD